MANTNEISSARREKTREMIQSLKDNKPCSRCKNIFPHYVLDWHHRNEEEKEFEISLAVQNNRSWENILREILKCDLVCSNCHRMIHHGSLV